MRLDKNRSLKFGLSVLMASAAIPAALAQQGDSKED
ncbi:unnamed protein product, partial [Laminaria digitata]